ncbi:MAG: helix-turn-helix domain-containing protein [Candidatus Aenigmarchaeota archaeon]|nr:helix-turn-helix domain-containing protein [Candidatus Aenigmarchaeota archaeon]
MNKWLIALIFVCLMSSIGFSQIYQYSVNVEIGDKIQYDSNIIVLGLSNDMFSLTIPGVVSDVSIKATGYFENTTFPLACTVTDTTLGKQLSCLVDRSTDKVLINAKYSSSDKLTKKEDYYIFSDSFKMPMNVDKFALLIKIPEGTALVKTDPYSPEDALRGSDGRKIFVYWNQENMLQGQTFDASVAYEETVLFDYSIIETILIVIVTGVVIVVVFLKYFMKQKKVEVILPVLKADEKKIFEAILKHESGVKQKIIVQESGYSKAKVSKVLKNLQERGLVKLEHIGRTNKVYYDEKLRNK